MKAEGRKYWRGVVENLKKLAAECETVSELLKKNEGRMELVYGMNLTSLTKRTPSNLRAASST